MLWSCQRVRIRVLIFAFFFSCRNTITRQQMVEGESGEGTTPPEGFPGGLPVPLSDMKRRRRTPPLPPNNLTEGSNDSVESVFSTGHPGEKRPRDSCGNDEWLHSW